MTIPGDDKRQGPAEHVNKAAMKDGEGKPLSPPHSLLGPRHEPQLTKGSAEALNGQFLDSYDSQSAEVDRFGALMRYRRGYSGATDSRLELQGRDGGRESPRTELILDTNNLLPFSFLRTGDRLGRAVVKLHRGDGAAGTGFLVAPGVILTNHHVLPNIQIARRTTAHANYEANPPADSAGRAAVVDLDPDGLFVTNKELDFSFCAVKGLEYLGFVPLERDSLSVVPSDSVNIIQHPRGRHKEVALQDNHVVKVDNLIIQYCCDTEPGSSGSPVFNNHWHLVALHHASVVVDDKDGGQSECGSEEENRFLNEGIRLSAIAVWLETAAADLDLGRDQANRVRSLFRGLDPQIGFFGALGRGTSGRAGPETVVECYHSRDGHVDLAYWNLAPLTAQLSQSLDWMCWFLASTAVDAWCLAHCNAELLEAFRETLQKGYRMEFQALPGPRQDGMPLGMLVRKSPILAAEWLGQTEGPLRLLLKAGAKRKKGHPFQLVPIVRGSDTSRKRIDTVIRESAEPRGSGLILLGDGLTARGLQRLSASYANVLSAFGNDGGMALLSGDGGMPGPVYVGPNLDLTIGSSQNLMVTRDRQWPAMLEENWHSRPLALRLLLPAIGTPKTRKDAGHGKRGSRADAGRIPENLVGDDTELESILCHLLAHLRSRGYRRDSSPELLGPSGRALRNPWGPEPGKA